jgi:sulfoxide reductase heme-binding subunit YedZ
MIKYFKPSIFVLSTIPFIVITYKIFFNKLGPEPVKETLLMSPLKKLTNLNYWVKVRRMLGLFVFFYASLHLLTYIGIDYRFSWQPIFDDVVKKKYIFVGFAAWVLLIPLTITSSQKMIILLKQNWKKLHRLIYVIAILGSLHFIWLSKTIYFKPLFYFVLITVLLALRINFKRMFEK